MLPRKLEQKLEQRLSKNALRSLGETTPLIDFSSNDYLGFSKSETIFDAAHNILVRHNIKQNGATGSRLLSGNHKLYHVAESQLSKTHNSASALIFNSGYNANIGFFSCIPQRGDIILYDEYSHASIRDGISMSLAKAYKFPHNNISALEALIERYLKKTDTDQHHIYVVTESVFSMDGDTPDLVKLSQLCRDTATHLVVDEAHAIGVFGKQGEGLVQHLNIEAAVFARIITFGKALGCHGAAILGNQLLCTYLINFCRSFIYTTALPPHSLATICSAYNTLKVSQNRYNLEENIAHFKTEIVKNNLQDSFISSNSAIHCCVISGNDSVKAVAIALQDAGFNVKPILSPTVPEHLERLRFCLHSYNTKKDITKVLQTLANFTNI